MEPNVTRDAVAGVFDRTYGLVSPYKLTIALAEHAVINGARLFLNTEVTGIRVEDGRVKAVVTDRGEIETGIVVNAAGVFADEVADMAGAGGFKIHPRKGATLLFDREVTAEYVHSQRGRVQAAAGRRRTSQGRRRHAHPGGQPAAGPDRHRGGRQVGHLHLRRGDRGDIREVPLPAAGISQERSVISAFSGIRAPTLEEDFVIGASKAHGFVNVAGHPVAGTGLGAGHSGDGAADTARPGLAAGSRRATSIR